LDSYKKRSKGLASDQICFVSKATSLFQENFAMQIPRYQEVANSPVASSKDMVKTFIQKDFLLTEIYFQSLNVISITQSAAMDVSDHFGPKSKNADVGQFFGQNI
jgi:hypothetical protein